MRNDRRKDKRRDIGGRAKDTGLKGSLYASGIILAIRNYCLFCDCNDI